MRILHLPTSADYAETSIRWALEVMAASGEPADGPVTLMVSPDEITEARRLIDWMADAKMLSKGAHAVANYLWTDKLRRRWMLIGRDAIVFSIGGGS